MCGFIVLVYLLFMLGIETQVIGVNKRAKTEGKKGKTIDVRKSKQSAQKWKACKSGLAAV